MTGTKSTTLSRLRAAAMRVAAGVVQVFLAFLTARSHRREIRELASLDERALKDIGLTRLDVLAALAEPPHKDPSTPLSVRSVARRARSRALALAAEQKAARGVPCPAPVARVTPPARAGA